MVDGEKVRVGVRLGEVERVDGVVDDDTREGGVLGVEEDDGVMEEDGVRVGGGVDGWREGMFDVGCCLEDGRSVRGSELRELLVSSVSSA